MRTKDLLLSGLNITEDDYDYRGLFILKADTNSLKVDIADLNKIEKLKEIKEYFNLIEEPSQIRELLMDMIMEKAHISSKITEGENYEKKNKRPPMNLVTEDIK